MLYNLDKDRLSNMSHILDYFESPSVSKCLDCTDVHACTTLFHFLTEREPGVGVVVFGLSSSVPSPLLGCLVFQLARYPAVIHPSTSRWPMSDRARTLSEDGERKGCARWISVGVEMRHQGRGFPYLTSLNINHTLNPRATRDYIWIKFGFMLMFVIIIQGEKTIKPTCIIHFAYSQDI